EVMKLIKDQNIKFVDFRFMDFPGTQQHFTIPSQDVNEEVFEEGLGFDGSSIRGWSVIDQSDMLVMPDAATAMVDPFYKIPTISVVGNIVDPITKERYTRDPRNVAIKAQDYLISTGIGDTAFFGPELEFFLFNELRFSYGSNHASH